MKSDGRIKPDEVSHIAHLARIEMRKGDLEKFTGQLSEILDYVDTLKKLDTDGIDPTFLTAPVGNRFREDRVKPSLDREETLQNAPQKEDGYFKAPRILKPGESS